MIVTANSQLCHCYQPSVVIRLSTMPIYDIPVAIMPALSFALHIIKDSVPSRFEKVGQYLKEFVSRNPATLNSTCIQVLFCFRSSSSMLQALSKCFTGLSQVYELLLFFFLKVLFFISQKIIIELFDIHSILHHISIVSIHIQ